jgi:hypothetical protein
MHLVGSLYNITLYDWKPPVNFLQSLIKNMADVRTSEVGQAVALLNETFWNEVRR